MSIKSMQIEPTGNSSLVCPVCNGTGNLLKIVNGKIRFNECICLGGCLYRPM